MRGAWKIYRENEISFGEALHIAWIVAKENRKALEAARDAAGVNEEVHTFYGWKKRGFEVLHGMRAVFKAIVTDETSKSGSRVLSYFSKSQVQAIMA